MTETDRLSAHIAALESRLAEVERERDELADACDRALRPYGVQFMDPPDGGSVTIGEQIERMSETLMRVLAERDTLAGIVERVREITSLTNAITYLAALNRRRP